MSDRILVNVAPHEKRIAITESGEVVELFVERTHSQGVVGNIYKGRVSKVLPGMQSAFVDIGLERDAFLYVSDVSGPSGKVRHVMRDEDDAGDDVRVRAGKSEMKIGDLVRENQDLVVQVAKEPLFRKGARITSFVTLPGRYVVYMPTVPHSGVSRKIVQESERQRLRRIIQGFRRRDEGVIVRTVGAGRSEEEIIADLDELRLQWEEALERAARVRAPSLLHRDLGLVKKVLRDYMGPSYSAVIIDDKECYDEVLELVSKVHPALAHRVRYYDRLTPLFDSCGVQEEIERALAPKVPLKSGGHLVINQTEALVAIDVNTGKYVGKKRLEDTVVKINLEAVKEVVRQLRLRDMGGIVVIDFIDMDERQNRQKVAKALEAELRKDRARTKMLQISDFGLVEITRKRVKQSLGRYLSQGCPYCEGSGRVKSVETVCYDIGRELAKLTDVKPRGKLLVRTHPEVARALRGPYAKMVKDLEDRLRVPLAIRPDGLLHHEQYDIMSA